MNSVTDKIKLSPNFSGDSGQLSKQGSFIYRSANDSIV